MKGPARRANRRRPIEHPVEPRPNGRKPGHAFPASRNSCSLSAPAIFVSISSYNGVQIIPTGDVDLGARDMGINGINVQTGGKITLTSNNTSGVCATGASNLQTVAYYRLVF